MLRPPVPNGYNEFAGGAVALSGHWLAVADVSGGLRGEVYLYARSEPGWQLRDKVVGLPSTRFGTSVALNGDTLAVGAPGILGQDVGARVVAIYERSGDRWVLEQRVRPPLPADGHTAFGWAVGLHGAVLAVGAPAEDEPAENSGSVHLFERSGGTFEWVRSAQLPRTPEVALGFYRSLGASVAVHGDTVVAGAPGWWGAAVVLEKQGGEWRQDALLTNASPTDGDGFGLAVDVEGDVIVVGQPAPGPGFPRRGAALVFENLAGQWLETAHLQASDGFASLDRTDQFGGAVAVGDGGLIVVGSINGRHNGDDTGSAYLFERCAGQGWCETGLLVSSSPQELSADLGAAVDVDGGFVVAGAPRTDSSSPRNGGAAYLFERPSSVPLCMGETNSTGLPATLEVLAGSGRLTVVGTDLPPGSPVVLLASMGHHVGPVGQSGLCLGPRYRRVEAGVSGVDGRIYLELRESQLFEERTHLQLWYSDHGRGTFSAGASFTSN